MEDGNVTNVVQTETGVGAGGLGRERERKRGVGKQGGKRNVGMRGKNGRWTQSGEWR